MKGLTSDAPRSPPPRRAAAPAPLPPAPSSERKDLAGAWGVDEEKRLWLPPTAATCPQWRSCSSRTPSGMSSPHVLHAAVAMIS